MLKDFLLLMLIKEIFNLYLYEIDFLKMGKPTNNENGDINIFIKSRIKLK